MELLKNKQSLKVYYEIIMAILSISVVIVLIIDSTCQLQPSTTNLLDLIDNIILIVFAIDYFTRLYLAKDKKNFLIHNIIDLIAIIPFNSMFQAARFLRLSRLLRFTKLFRSVALLLKFRKHIDRFIKTNNFHYVVWITLITLLIGTLGIHFKEGVTLGNALWWSFVTITTVGYGDISPTTPIGRLLAGFLMLIGIGFLSMLTGTIATFFLNRKGSTSYKNETIENVKSKLDNFEGLSIEDIDNIYKILKALKE